MAEAADCRFDGSLFIGEGLTTRTWNGRTVGTGWRPSESWFRPDGRPWLLMYHCGACGQVHWTVPALECDGSSPDHADSVRESVAAVRAAGYTVTEAEIEATIAAGLPPFATNVGRARYLLERLEREVARVEGTH